MSEQDRSHTEIAAENDTPSALSPSPDPDWSPTPDLNSTPFTKAVDQVLHLTAELARQLVGSHQGAAALIVKDDWKDMRKYFSLSPKYAAWGTYRTPAVGYGIHATVVEANTSIRLTQAELERHPDWKGFGVEAGKHPRMRGWLAVPIVGRDGKNYGLLQLSDKYDDADFTEEDEVQLMRLAQLTSIALDALWHQYHHQTANPSNVSG
jgi:GAF domain-containing protein